MAIAINCYRTEGGQGLLFSYTEVHPGVTKKPSRQPTQKTLRLTYVKLDTKIVAYLGVCCTTPVGGLSHGAPRAQTYLEHDQPDAQPTNNKTP